MKVRTLAFDADISASRPIPNEARSDTTMAHRASISKACWSTKSTRRRMYSDVAALRILLRSSKMPKPG